jgi:hypothetical protein
MYGLRVQRALATQELAFGSTLRLSGTSSSIPVSPSIVNGAFRTLSGKSGGIGRTWDRINSRSDAPPPLDADVAARLRDDLQPDIDRLAVLNATS